MAHEPTHPRLTVHPSCPAWCIGHLGGPSGSHMSPSAYAGTQDDLVYPKAVAVTLVTMHGEDDPRVMVARYRQKHDTVSAFLPQEDAAAWADILDGAGAGDLADAIRATLALTEATP